MEEEYWKTHSQVSQDERKSRGQTIGQDKRNIPV